MEISVHPEMKLEPDQWEIYRTMSKTEPGTYHITAARYIDIDIDGVVDCLCSCKGFAYKKWCWHVEELGMEA